MKRLKSAFLVLLVNVAVLLAGLAFIEITVIFFLTHPKLSDKIGLSPILGHVHGSIGNVVQNSDCGKFDAGLFYTLRPGDCSFDSDVFSSTFSTKLHVNSLGTRDEESALVAPEIVCLGDSVTMGWGVQQDEAYPQLLHKLTGKKVLNAAVSSYGTAREMKMLERIDTSHMKYLIIQWVSNDHGENLEFLKNNTLVISPEVEFYTAYMINKERRQYYPGRLTWLLLQQAWKNVKSYVHKFATAKTVTPPPAQQNASPAAVKPDPTQKVLASFASAMLRTIINSKPKAKDFQLIITFPSPGMEQAVRDDIAQHPEYPDYIQKAILYNYGVGTRTTKDDYILWDEHFSASGHVVVARDLASLILRGRLPDIGPLDASTESKTR